MVEINTPEAVDYHNGEAGIYICRAFRLFLEVARKSLIFSRWILESRVTVFENWVKFLI